MDEIKFLKLKPGEAIERIEVCMTAGYQLVDKIRDDYQKNLTNPNPLIKQELHDRYVNWITDTITEIEAIYHHLSKAYDFREAKTTRYSTTGDNELTYIDNDFECKIKILREYKDFIMKESHPTIAVNGDLNFQVGENLKYEKKK